MTANATIGNAAVTVVPNKPNNSPKATAPSNPVPAKIAVPLNFMKSVLPAY